MKKTTNNGRKTFTSTLFLLLFAFGLISGITTAQDKNGYKVLKYNTGISNGKDKEITNLFNGDRRTIVQLTLRENRQLGFHSVKEPITIYCITGKGELIIGDESKSEKVKLEPGSYVTIESDVLHNVTADPEISILLVKFTEGKADHDE